MKVVKNLYRHERRLCPSISVYLLVFIVCRIYWLAMHLFFGLMVVISQLNILLRVLEPAKLLWHRVKSLLQHDSLGDDKYHMAAYEQLPSNCGVHPLFAIVVAGQEVILVNEDATPYLNGDVDGS